MTPRTAALAYRVWAFCEPRGWDCTLHEIADALDVPMTRVRSVVLIKRWHQKLRGASLDYRYHGSPSVGFGGFGGFSDSALADLAGHHRITAIERADA